LKRPGTLSLDHRPPRPLGSADKTLASKFFTSVPDTPSTGDQQPLDSIVHNSDDEADFSLTRSQSAEVVSTTPLRSILKPESQAALSPALGAKTTPSRRPSAPDHPLPVQSISGLRAVSFRDARSSSSEASPLFSHSPRAKTLPASQLAETLTDFNLTRPSPTTPSSATAPSPTPLTPSRRGSLSVGGPSPALLLEENSRLVKEVAQFRLFAQETDSLNRENQIEIQFLMEGKGRLLADNRLCKEKLAESVARVEELKKRLAESERRGRGSGGVRAREAEEDEREVREEILLTKIRLEEENTQLKESLERLEREHLKLKRKLEEGPDGATVTGPVSTLATQQEILSLRETLRCRDLQISRLCLPQTASQSLHQIVLSSSSLSGQLPSAMAGGVEDDLHSGGGGGDTTRDSLPLISPELSQLLTDSALLSRAPPLPPPISSAPISPELRDCLVADMNEVVADLIASKLLAASLSTQLDIEVMKQRLVKGRLGRYATRVSQLEVENIALCSRIALLLQPQTPAPASERRGSSWYPSWLQRYLH
jgi:hypothetical protein